MANAFVVAPSILAVWDASGGRTEAVVEAALAVERAGAEWIHVDVMDGRFVPRLTFGAEMVRALKKGGVKAPLDVHLMMEDVDGQLEDYVAAGADRVVFHPSACEDVRGCLRLLRDAGVAAGLALDVGEEVDWVRTHRDDMDQVLVMTVAAGAGGQPCRTDLFPKVRKIRDLCGEGMRLAVDGGINDQTAEMARKHGADAVVAGSFVFGTPDPAGRMGLLRGAP